MFVWTRILLAAALAIPAGATTLQQLSLSEMIAQSTAIVRAKVTGTRAAYRGTTIYTYYKLSVVENLKATTPATVEVAVPGGVVNGLRQTVAGAPTPKLGEEYVIFLWTSKSGLTQVIGLSQGLFSVQEGATGQSILLRLAAGELMVNAKGQPVEDQPVSLGLDELRRRVRGGR